MSRQTYTSTAPPQRRNLTAASDERPKLRVLSSSSRDRSRRAATAHASRVGLIAHAGLAATRVGGAPTRTTLRRAMKLRVAALELDVCASADGELVLHHDRRLPVGLPVADLTLQQLRRVEPGLLTLAEGLEVVGDDAKVIIDVKTGEAAGPLSDWFHHVPTDSRTVVCSSRRDVLRFLTRAAPTATFWQTFPEIGDRAHERVFHVLAGLASHRGRHTRKLVADLWGAASHARHPRHAVTQLAGIPWRTRLPSLLPASRLEFDAGGVAVHHSLITPELCEAARELDMTVVAWTVNSPMVAKRAARCGVDLITTDDVVGVRRALRPPRSRQRRQKAKS